MKSFSVESTQVFLVRIWREPREIESAPPQWRGSIEHLPSGERRYVKDLDEIVTFMAPYLVHMGVIAKPSSTGLLAGVLKRIRRTKP